MVDKSEHLTVVRKVWKMVASWVLKMADYLGIERVGSMVLIWAQLLVLHWVNEMVDKSEHLMVVEKASTMVVL